MDYQALQETVKSDLETISTLKLPIVSARELYGSLIWFVLKLSTAFFGINMLMLGGLYEIGFYHSTLSFGAYLQMCVAMMAHMWGLTLMMSIFILAFINPIILFSLFAKDRLKTWDFIKVKYTQLRLIYVLIYAIIFGLFTASHDGFHAGFYQSSYEAYDAFGLTFSQGMSFVISIVVMSCLINIEIS